MVAFVNRRLLALTGLVLVSVAAMSMSAATLRTATGGEPAVTNPIGPDPVDSGNGTSGGPQGNVSQIDLGNGGDDSSQTISLAGCNELLASIPGGVVYFGGMVAALYGLKRRFSLGALIFGGYAIVPTMLAVYFLRTDCISTGGPGPGSGGGGIGRVLQDTAPTPDVPASVMLGVFALLFVGVAAAIFVSSGDQEYVADDEDDEEAGVETDVEEIAEAAANAAERLEERNADVDNEVYRAWWEMTQLLDVSSPETFTPGEFAEAAVEVGVDRRYVDPLTTLFEEVRYGHEDPESREERAIEVFRAIEAEYGDGARGGPGSADGATGGADGDDAEGDA